MEREKKVEEDLGLRNNIIYIRSISSKLEYRIGIGQDYKFTLLLLSHRRVTIRIMWAPPYFFFLIGKPTWRTKIT